MNVEKYFHGSSTLSQGITWSVSIEEQFYLFWPLIFFILPKRLWIHSIIVIIVGSILFRILNYDDSFVLYYHTFSVIEDLGIGAVFAYLIKESKKVKQFFETSSTYTHLLLITFSFSICFFNDYIFQFQYGNSIGRVFISFSFALIITAQALTKSESKLNLMNFSFANKWGKYTYGIYLLHPIAITTVGILFKSLHISETNFVNSFCYCVLGFILTLVFSKFSFNYFEYRFLRLKSKFTEVKSGSVDFQIKNG